MATSHNAIWAGSKSSIFNLTWAAGGGAEVKRNNQKSSHHWSRQHLGRLCCTPDLGPLLRRPNLRLWILLTVQSGIGARIRKGTITIANAISRRRIKTGQENAINTAVAVNESANLSRLKLRSWTDWWSPVISQQCLIKCEVRVCYHNNPNAKRPRHRFQQRNQGQNCRIWPENYQQIQTDCINPVREPVPFLSHLSCLFVLHYLSFSYTVNPYGIFFHLKNNLKFHICSTHHICNHHTWHAGCRSFTAIVITWCRLNIYACTHTWLGHTCSQCQSTQRVSCNKNHSRSH